MIKEWAAGAMTGGNIEDIWSPETVLTHTGREPADHFGFVNTPVFRGSTVVFESLAALDAHSQPYAYGRHSSPTTRGVEQTITALEGAFATTLCPSGLSAVTLAILACVKSGDEILIPDTAYDPTRTFATGFLDRMGVSTRFYDPTIGAAISDLFTEKTRAVFVESPGSLTFEMQDLPAIASAAKPHGIRVIVDNSWATPLFHKPLSLGADIVLHAGTKMFVGHSDAFCGTVSSTEEIWPDIARTRRLLGLYVSGDEAYLTARGLRTLALRMREHDRRSRELAAWFVQQPGIARVLHPALPHDPGHAIFERDFSGSGSLFGVVLDPAPREALARMVDGMRLFSMGYSWGGYESLILPANPAKIRTAIPWQEPGNLVRIHVGLEGFDDLKSDLAAGLERYRSP